MGVPGIEESELLAWLLASIEQNKNCISFGNQGNIYFYNNEHHPVVVKAPPAKGLMRFLHVKMLQREYHMYKRLQGLTGVPKCYGLLENQYLVLEFIDGKILSKQTVDDWAVFFDKFFELISSLHARGVAHADLKRRSNVIIGANNQPYVVDFGVAVGKKENSFHPLNSYIFSVAKRFDLNAWVKHKYKRRYEDITVSDRAYFRLTIVERFARLIKQTWLKALGKI